MLTLSHTTVIESVLKFQGAEGTGPLILQQAPLVSVNGIERGPATFLPICCTCIFIQSVTK